LKHLFILCISVFLITSTSCKKDRIKIEGVERIAEIPFCEKHPVREYRIEDQSAFKILLDGFMESEICESFTVPELDFNEVSVLGFETLSSFCENDYSFNVDAKPEESIYEYTVNVRLNAECTELERRMHWISLPKIPSDYQIEFRQVEN